MEEKIQAQLGDNGDVQFRVPKSIMDRNQPEITYSVFEDIDTGDVVYHLQLHLEERSDN